MAGRGSRLRPHTLTIPKPLIPVAGKPIVQRLVEDIVTVCDQTIEEIAFVIGDFGKEMEENLLRIAESLGAKGKIYYQKEPLGTAHAILCAKQSLSGNTVVAFADTLFKADFTLKNNKDGTVWVSEIDDPSAFGVVKLNNRKIITDFVEKPTQFVSNLAIIGIYYFKDGAKLRSELQYLIENNIKEKGEFQLTNALENMKNKGLQFSTGKVEKWLDCGNKEAIIDTNKQILQQVNRKNLTSNSARVINSEIQQPCFIDDDAEVINSCIGPHVSIGKNTKIENSKISNSIIQTNTNIVNGKLKNSMVGNYVSYKGKKDETDKEISLGDFSEIK